MFQWFTASMHPITGYPSPRIYEAAPLAMMPFGRWPRNDNHTVLPESFTPLLHDGRPDFAQIFPLEGQFDGSEDARLGTPQEVLEALGMCFMGKHDRLLQRVTLPQGWGYDGISGIHDAQGNLRVLIMYREPYGEDDGDALYQVMARYGYAVANRIDQRANMFTRVVNIMEGNEVIHRIETRASLDAFDPNAAMGRGMDAEVRAWLDQHRPDWVDPVKQWQ